MSGKTTTRRNMIGQTYTIPTVFWILTGLIIAVIFFMHSYGDILITAKQGKIFWNCLFSGKPMSFYKEAVFELDYPYNNYVYHAAYPFTTYFLFAIWELPVWIIESITKSDLFNTIPNKIWLKVFLILFVIICMQRLYKLVSHIDEIKDKAHLAAYLFMASSLLLISTGIASQYDVISLYFILLGLDYWVCGKKTGFFWAFTVAVSFKYFALMYFVPLLLIKEKKIFKIIAATICSVLPTLFIMFIFPKPDTQISNVRNLIGGFMRETVNLGKSYVVPFLAIMIFACIWAYFFNSKDKIKDAVFILLVVAGAFCFVADTYPYWSVLGAPIFILAVLLSNGNINKAIWCETIMNAGFVVICYMRYSIVFSSKTLAAMGLFPSVFGVPLEKMGDLNIGANSLLNLLPIKESIYYTVVICAWVFLMVLVRPKQKKIELLEPLSYWSIALRSVANIGIAALPLLINFAYFVVLHRT